MIQYTICRILEVNKSDFKKTPVYFEKAGGMSNEYALVFAGSIYFMGFNNVVKICPTNLICTERLHKIQQSYGSIYAWNDVFRWKLCRED
jgi:hypothetical protein